LHRGGVSHLLGFMRRTRLRVSLHRGGAGDLLGFMRGTLRGISLGSPFAVTRLASGSGGLAGSLPFPVSRVVRTLPCLESLKGRSTSVVGGRFSLAEIWILKTSHVGFLRLSVCRFLSAIQVMQ
jgi:hypothetical protein